MAFLRNPAVHFLIAGMVLFLGFSWFRVENDSETSADSLKIVVERDALLAFVQSKTKTVNEVELRRFFAEMNADSRRTWIDRYVREEVLVREARALGLDREDEIIRRRLAQKIEFLTLGLLEEEMRIDEAELEAFHLEHREDYRVPAIVTFTHVFIRPASDEGPDRAKRLLSTLNEERVSFRDALGLGDRFLYNRNYVDRTIDEIRSHFGDEMASWLEVANPDDSIWTGPHRSLHGWHLVLFTRRTETRLPEFDEIAPVIRQDAERRRRESVLETAIDALVEKYRVELAFDSNARPSAGQ